MAAGGTEPTRFESYRPGSDDDFDRLYRTCYARLVRTLYAIVGDAASAEDCVQEAFVKAYRAWPRFRPERPAEAWVHQIAVNTAISHRRRQKLREVGELLRRLGRPPDAADPAAVAEDHELVAALAALSPKLSVAFVLRHYHGYSVTEIAVLTNTPERTVRHRVALARERLRERLGREHRAATLPQSPGPDVAIANGDAGPGA